jgi:hypothetical protein
MQFCGGNQTQTERVELTAPKIKGPAEMAPIIADGYPGAIWSTARRLRPTARFKSTAERQR